MRSQSVDYLEAATHLPPGGKLQLNDISWDEYEGLLDQFGEGSHFRISYDRGRLEIMSPSFKHEKYKDLLHDLVLILSDELDQEILSYGSATLRHKSSKKAAEGDGCFYVQRASEIDEKDQLDLSHDPPPDLVVEIDLTHDSSGKFDIYATMGVPEIWCYDGKRSSIWQLTGQAYARTSFSLAFPFLAAEHLDEFVSNSETHGRKQGRHTFRDWVRRTKPGTS
jgi:Uma2 family endonuclease